MKARFDNSLVEAKKAKIEGKMSYKNKRLISIKLCQTTLCAFVLGKYKVLRQLVKTIEDGAKYCPLLYMFLPALWYALWLSYTSNVYD